jgi:hypothetical protein
MTAEIVRFESLSKPRKVGCGTCLFYKEDSVFPLSRCKATSQYADYAWEDQCKQGTLWQAIPAPVPILIRFKRWLIG